MLVVSRGKNDKVVFPSLGISVEILRIAGNKVRVGVDAPQEIPVLRHEIADKVDPIVNSPKSEQEVPAGLSHAMRNRLHTAALGLHVLHKKIESGDSDDAEATIFQIFNELKSLEDALDPACSQARTSDAQRASRALLVEDDDNERELMAGFLRMSGFEVDTAMDGLQAMVHLAKQERPDVVLLDMRMPRFDGRRTVTAIRDNPDYQGLRIFAVSGTEQSEIDVDVSPRGVDRWFSKPVDPRTIVEAIREELTLECATA